jgi:hypothetical protein
MKEFSLVGFPLPIKKPAKWAGRVTALFQSRENVCNRSGEQTHGDYHLSGHKYETCNNCIFKKIAGLRRKTALREIAKQNRQGRLLCMTEKRLRLLQDPSIEGNNVWHPTRA